MSEKAIRAQLLEKIETLEDDEKLLSHCTFPFLLLARTKPLTRRVLRRQHLQGLQHLRRRLLLQMGDSTL